MTDQEELEYISLQAATKFCNYSQEYLSLRARQGKLKSAKFGRKWVTTKAWLDEYLAKFAIPGVMKAEISPATNNFLSNDNRFLEKRNFLLPPEIVQEVSLKIDPLPIQNLPTQNLITQKAGKIFGWALSVGLALFFFGIIFSSFGGDINKISSNLKASALFAFEGLSKTIEIKNSWATTDISVANEKYDCRCDCKTR
jgi:hypothetical protein